MSDYERPWVEFEDGFILTTGKPDHWVIRKRVNETTNPGDEDFKASNFRAIGHYTSLTNALAKLIEKKAQNQATRSLSELKESIHAARQEIVDGIKGEL